MAIDTATSHSPGWWMERAFQKLEGRRKRLDELAAWLEGNPPTPEAVKTARAAFSEFEAESVTNFAELIVSSVRERMTVREIRTSASGEKADDEARKHWIANNLDVEMPSIIETMLGLGDSYSIVGKDALGNVTATSEDPRQVVTFHNPLRQAEVTAGLKMYRDADGGRDYAVLMLPGGIMDDPDSGEPTKYNARVFTAYRALEGEADPKATGFSPENWDWDVAAGGAEGMELPHQLVPIVRFRNRNGKSEFEPHLPILRRINRLVFQMTVIALYQAYRQRAVAWEDKEDAEIELQGEFQEKLGLDQLDDVLTADPGSWFLLPRGAKVWESNQADMNGILKSIQDETLRLAAVSRRPMAIFAPDNQAAEGAKFTREGLIFAVEDKITRVTEGIRDLYHLIFLTAGDAARAEKHRIIVGWKPTERYAVTDMASATAQSGDRLPLHMILREIWQKTPEEIAQIDAELADERLLLEDLTEIEAGGGGRPSSSLTRSALAVTPSES